MDEVRHVDGVGFVDGFGFAVPGSTIEEAQAAARARTAAPIIQLEEAISTRDFAVIAAKSDQFANPRNATRFGSALRDAAKCNDVELLACLLANGCPGRKDVCALAAERGHLACLVYANKHGCAWDEDTSHELGCSCDEDTCDDNACALAAVNGHLDCLTYAH